MKKVPCRFCKVLYDPRGLPTHERKCGPKGAKAAAPRIREKTISIKTAKKVVVEVDIDTIEKMVAEKLSR